MATAAYYDASQLANVAIEQMDSLIEGLLLAKIPLFEKIKQDNIFNQKVVKWATDHWIIPFRYKYPGNVRAVAEKGYIPTTSAGAEAQMYANPCKTMITLGLTWEQKRVNQGRKTFVIDVMDDLRKQAERVLKDQTAIQGWGGEPTYNGAIAKVKSSDNDATSVLTLYCHDGTNHASGQPGSKYCRVGQSIFIDAVADLSGTPTEAVVTSVDDHETITLDGQVANEDGIYVIPGETISSEVTHQYGYTPTGVQDHVNTTAPTTYQGVTRSDYAVLAANLYSNSGTSRELTMKLIQRAMDAPLNRTGEALEHDNVAMSSTLRQDYYDLFDSLVRFRPGEGLGGSDHRKVKMPSGVKPYVDPYCPPGQVFFLNTDSFVLALTGPWFEFEKGLNGEMFALRSTMGQRDIYELRGRTHWQLIGLNPPSNSRITDLYDDPTAT